MTEQYKSAPGDLWPDEVSPADVALGLDFGGSGIKGAAVDIKRGRLVGYRLRAPTPQPSVPAEVVTVMAGLVRALATPWSPGPGDSFSVGVGIPAAIRNGATATAANIDAGWVGFPAEAEMSRVMGRTVVAGNDADVAGLAEVRFGAGRNRPGLTIVLTIGTGIGTALFIDGRLVPNTELGHLELKGRDAESLVAESARSRLGLGWKEWAAGFDEYLHLLEQLFWPDLFIFGGGASKRAENYAPLLTVKTPILLATFRTNAGIIGAALIAHERSARAAGA
jgi:polyphosphate glucokinase